MKRGTPICTTLMLAVLLVSACRKDHQGSVPPVAQSWADTLSLLTGPYSGVHTTWSQAGPGPQVSHSTDTTLILEPNPSSPGHFRLGGYEAFLTIHRDLSITAPTGNATFTGELVILPESINLHYARVSYSPGGTWGSGFTGHKNL